MNWHLVDDDHPLTLQLVLARVRSMYGDAEVVTQLEQGRRRTSYAELGERVDRLAGALRELGVERGDRVATFCFNTQEHLELYLAVPCLGAVLHTVNVRLFEDDLEYIFNDAGAKLLFVDAPPAERIAPLRDRLRSVERIVVIGDEYEALLAEQPAGFDYPVLDDRAPAGLCYTSGTTGKPKGVVYSHRSQALHSLGICAADAMGVSSADRVLPVVPMFHANAWGLPYGAAMTGADLLLPGRFTGARALLDLMQDEQATIAAAVPTIWLDLLREADEHGADLSNLRTVICGGAAVPLALMRAFEERHGVRILQAWGMTETGPLASLARPPRHAAGQGGDAAWRYRDTAGRLLPFVEARLVAESGEVLPHDGEHDGELEVRGPWVATGYLGVDAPDKFHDGWLRTGDVATIDREGYLRITDRAKDVIKSGGEWISSVELENAIMGHPDVLEAAVVGLPHERWQGRPLACVVARPGREVTKAVVIAHLEPLVAKWWLPADVVFVEALPKTSVGKIAKRELREQFKDHCWPDM